MSANLLRLDQIAANLVVEELDGLPLDTLSGVLVLLGLERELDEDLLQLLVDVVDAQLLEAVFLHIPKNTAGGGGAGVEPPQ